MLDGSVIKLERSGVVTQYGFVQKIKGAGMPIYESSSQGDLFVEYLVVFPDHVDSSVIEGKIETVSS
jgi:DnaJ-related protein SCJ1